MKKLKHEAELFKGALLAMPKSHGRTASGGLYVRRERCISRNVSCTRSCTKLRSACRRTWSLR